MRKTALMNLDPPESAANEPSCVIFDELRAQPSRDLWSIMTAGREIHEKAAAIPGAAKRHGLKAAGFAPCLSRTTTQRLSRHVTTIEIPQDLKARHGRCLLAGAARQLEKAYYERDGQPLGVLSTKTDSGGYAQASGGGVPRDPDGSAVTRREKLRREWEKVHAGPSAAHRIAVLDNGLSYTLSPPATGTLSLWGAGRCPPFPLLSPSARMNRPGRCFFLSERRAGLEIRINLMAELQGGIQMLDTVRGGRPQRLCDPGVKADRGALRRMECRNLADGPGGGGAGTGGQRALSR